MLLFLLLIVFIILNILILLIIIVIILIIIYICIYICNLLKPRYMKHILNMEKVSAPSPIQQSSDPVDFISKSSFHKCCRLDGSMPLVGSSRKITGMSPSKALATHSRRFWPPDKVVHCWSTFSSIPETKGDPGEKFRESAWNVLNTMSLSTIHRAKPLDAFGKPMLESVHWASDGMAWVHQQPGAVVLQTRRFEP